MRSFTSRVFVLSLSSAAVGLATACGTAHSNLIMEDEFPSAYAQALCTSLQHCCDENVVTFDYNACTTGWKTATADNFFKSIVNYDAKTATDCIGQIRAAQGNPCILSQGSVADARTTCLSIFTGRKPLGAPCTSATECAPSESGERVGCEATSTSSGGTLPLSVSLGPVRPRDLHLEASVPVCVAIAAPQQGAPCATGPGKPGVTDCGEGLFCNAANATCEVQAQAGQACVPGGCAPGGFCIVRTGGSVCGVSSEPGQPCDNADGCDGTSRCDLTGSKTCVVRLDAGAACSADPDCTSGICDATAKKCLKNAFATTAACTGRGH